MRSYSWNHPAACLQDPIYKSGQMPSFNHSQFLDLADKPQDDDFGK